MTDAGYTANRNASHSTDGRRLSAQLTPAELYRAALYAGAAAFGLWARTTSEYAADARATLNGPGRRPGDRSDLPADLLEAYLGYVRSLTLLPRVCGLRFLNELRSGRETKPR